MTTTVQVHHQDRDAWQAPTAVLRVSLAGCGVVGSALLREFAARRESLAERLGVQLVLASVLVRDVDRPRDAAFDRSVLTHDVDEFLAARADVVIEAIGGIDPAHRIAVETLLRGRKLVTANKALLAAHGSALADLATRHATSLRYDAAVGGGVPILRMLDDALGSGTPRRVRGILNGTANYVLTRLEAGATFDSALRHAHAAGFAEVDATRDLDGRDAADKIALIAWAAFGVAPESLVVHRHSLTPSPVRYSSLAARLGLALRQVAECCVVHGEVIATVEPLLVASDSALARTTDEQNWVEVDAGWSAPLTASGPGAGGLPTANSLLADLVAPAALPARRGSLPAGDVDIRTWDWVIEAIAPPQSLHAAIPACALVHTDVHATTTWTVVRAATRAHIQSILRTLEGVQAQPIAARIDSESVPAHFIETLQ